MPLIDQLISKLGSEKVMAGEAVRERYHHIWKMNEPLQAKAVLFPKTTQDVSDIMKICQEHKQAVVVHGGLTNMVGSTETNSDELVISMEKMNVIEEVDERSRTMTVQAGVILENIQKTAQEKDLLFPLNFGAKGSAQIGGNISTNAGGLRVFRFGMTRNQILGLEVVLADGTIISSMKKIIKDNSAYDLKHLFIGSEGTLGIVSKAVLKLREAPRSRTSAFVAFDNYNQVIDFLKYMDKGLAGTLSAFELIWGETYQALTSPPAPSKPPLPHGYNYYVLLDSLGSDPVADQAKLEQLLGQALENETISDATLAQSDADQTWFWKIREDVHVMVTLVKHDQHFDISLPIPQIGPVLADINVELEKIPEVDKIFSFGHMADGNIHLIVGKSIESKALTNQINNIVYGPLMELKGSVSAEHGIGMHKKAYLKFCRTPEEIQLMKTMKKALDPLNILNRGKIFEQSI